MKSMGMSHGVVYVDPHVGEVDKFTALSSCYFATHGNSQFYCQHNDKWLPMTKIGT